MILSSNYCFLLLQRISWKLNGQSIESSDQSLISTKCDETSCLSKLVYNSRKIISPTNSINNLSCIAENEYGYEQSRLYHVDLYDDQSTTIVSTILGLLLLIILSMAIAYCGCRVRHKQKNSSKRKSILLLISIKIIFSF